MAALHEVAHPNNLLLDRLLQYDVRGVVAGALLRRQIRPLAVVLRGDERMPEVLFPLTCVFSTLVSTEEGCAVDVGSIGREGVAGTRWLYSEAHSPNLFVRCTIGGDALGMPYETLREIYRSNESIRRIVDRYFRARYDAMLQLSACSVTHGVLQRCARLLSNLTESVGRNDIAITHETLAEMLGTRRASVTVSIANLVESGAIDSARRSLVVIDRTALRRAACLCQTTIANLYAAVGLPLAYEGDDTVDEVEIRRFA